LAALSTLKKSRERLQTMKIIRQQKKKKTNDAITFVPPSDQRAYTLRMNRRPIVATKQETEEPPERIFHID